MTRHRKGWNRLYSLRKWFSCIIIRTRISAVDMSSINKLDVTPVIPRYSCTDKQSIICDWAVFSGRWRAGVQTRSVVALNGDLPLSTWVRDIGYCDSWLHPIIWNRIILGKLVVAHLVKKLSAFNGTERFISVFNPLDPTLSQENPVRVLTPCVLERLILLHIILPYALTSAKFYLSFKNSDKTFVCLSHLSHAWGYIGSPRPTAKLKDHPLSSVHDHTRAWPHGEVRYL
jgi:hypothetical protein